MNVEQTNLFFSDAYALSQDKRARKELRKFWGTIVQEQGLVSPSVLARMAKVSPQYVHQLREAGKLKSFRFFGAVYISGKEATDWLLDRMEEKA